MAPPDHRPVLDRSRAAVLAAATRLLVESPELSLAELAARIGIGRTTLHRMFPTREAVLAAVAHDAIDHLASVYAEAGIGVTDDNGQADQAGAGATGSGVVPVDPLAPIVRLVGLLVPLGPRLMFLIRSAELRDDTGIDRRVSELDRPLLQQVASAQRAAALDTDLPAWWIIESLYACVYIAWEQVERGRLAAQDAGPLVVRTWLHGVQPSRHLR